MKYIFSASVLMCILMLFQSNVAMSWGQELRQEFLRSCIEGASEIEYSKAKTYCTCSVNEMIDSYTVDEIQRIGEEKILSEPLVKRIVAYCAEKTLE